MKVLKFGGSSVANPERIKNVIDIVVDKMILEDFMRKRNIHPSIS